MHPTCKLTARSNARLAVPLLLVALTVACAPEESMEAAAPEAAPLSAGPELTTLDWSVGPDPMLEIGVREGPAEYQLSNVTDAARLSDGRIVVADAQGHFVRIYRPDGTFDSTLGAEGSGPGEFRTPTQLLVTRGDSVIVWDSGLERRTAFAADGTLGSTMRFDRSRTTAAAEPPLYAGPVQLLGSGDWLLRLVDKPVTKDAPDLGSARGRSGAVWMAADYSEMRPLAEFRDDELQTVEAPWGPFQVAPPIGRSTLLAASPVDGAACWGEADRFEVTCRNGHEEHTIGWAGQAKTADPNDPMIERWRRSQVALMSAKLSEEVVLDVLSGVTVPEYRPAYESLTLDDQGRVWVEEGPDGEGLVDYAVVGVDGTLVGRVKLPPMTLLEVGDDYVIGLHEDELGVQSVRVWGLVRGG